MTFFVIKHLGKDECGSLTYCMANPRPKTIECKVCHKQTKVLSQLEYAHSKVQNAFVIMHEAATHRAAREVIWKTR